MTPTDALKNRVYYSQNREDLILESFFPDVEKGFYVDVGASDPTRYSVTKLFYDNGWSGINVEPIKHHYEALKRQRSRDINLNIGVGKKRATMTFHEYTSGDGLSTFSTEMAEAYSKLDDDLYRHAKQYEVKVVTLQEVFSTHKIETIHFLKVDVEGFEYDVLAGNDWNTYRPEVICIEANHVTNDWHPLLQSNHYTLAFFDGLNEYYVDSKTSRQTQFDFVANVVLRKDGGIRYTDYLVVDSLEKDLDKERQVLHETHVRLQDALAASAQNGTLYQAALAENHNNHVRAAVAEKALKSPTAFMKYQLKRLHRAILAKLTAERSVPELTKEEAASKQKALHELAGSKTDKQRLMAAQRVAQLETNRLKRIYQSTNRQSSSLRMYLKLVNGLKLLRMRRRA